MRRANRTYEYLSLVESVRIDGKNTHRTLFRLGEASALRETGELDRIIAALQAHAERRYVDIDQLEVDAAPMVGTMAAVRHLWDDLGLQSLFEQIGEQAGCAFSLADAVFAMLAEGWSIRRPSGAPTGGSSTMSSPRTPSPSRAWTSTTGPSTWCASTRARSNGTSTHGCAT